MIINTPKDFESIPGYCATSDIAEEELWSEQKGSCRIVYWKENTASLSGKFIIRTNDQYNNRKCAAVIPKGMDSDAVIGYLEKKENIAELMQENNITSLRTSISAQDLTNEAKLERRIAWRLSKILHEVSNYLKAAENDEINNCKDLLKRLMNSTTKEDKSIGWDEKLIVSDVETIFNRWCQWIPASDIDLNIKSKIIERLVSLRTDIVDYVKLVGEGNLKQGFKSEEETGFVESKQNKLRLT